MVGIDFGEKNYCDWLPVYVNKQWVLHNRHCESISASTINVYVFNGLILRNNSMYALTNLVTELNLSFTVTSFGRHLRFTMESHGDIYL